MSDWKDLPKATREALADLGNFAPTINVQARELKGYMLDRDGDCCKTYFSATDLRELSAHLNVAADWLDRRANEAQP